METLAVAEKSVAGGLLLVVSHMLREPAGNTRAWLAFAEWATQWF